MCLVSARGELFQNVLLKTSWLILSMKEKGEKGILDLKNGFVLLSPCNLKQQHSIFQMIQAPSASSPCGEMSKLEECSRKNICLS